MSVDLHCWKLVFAVVFNPKSVMFLTEIAENNDDGCSDNLSDGGKKMKPFYEQFYEEIIQQNIGSNNHQVTK